MATSTQLRQRIAAGEWDSKLRALYGNTEQELCRQRAQGQSDRLPFLSNEAAECLFQVTHLLSVFSSLETL